MGSRGLRAPGLGIKGASEKPQQSKEGFGFRVYWVGCRGNASAGSRSSIEGFRWYS